MLGLTAAFTATGKKWRSIDTLHDKNLYGFLGVGFAGLQSVINVMHLQGLLESSLYHQYL
jgi:hypothetical protein